MAADGISGKTLEERVRLIEDRFAIYDLIARHPPSADTGAGEFVASVWAEDGVCRISAAERAGDDRGGVGKPGASPRDRGRHRAFRRAALCAGRW
jgi:hypothetical protein